MCLEEDLLMDKVVGGCEDNLGNVCSMIVVEIFWLHEVLLP